MVAGYVLVSLTIWIAARVSPKEWREIEPCEECLWKKYGEECEHLSCEGTSGICSDESEDEISEIDHFGECIEKVPSRMNYKVVKFLSQINCT
ncbi:unnamed protein product [Diabrotica balteata]|uniref:Uncharacterized protein n=1 Tax=Diabrotica balteata TaxID=107213 RepID=A0A9N9XFC8_DIABA|nr:unnamed protein product [Diabrotica balteata]